MPADQRPRGRLALHPIWVFPLVVAFSVVLFVIAALSWCGISGCSGGGWGRDVSDTWLAILACCVAAVALALPLLLIPLVRRRAIRIPVGIGSGLAWGYLIAVVSHGEGPWFTP